MNDMTNLLIFVVPILNQWINFYYRSANVIKVASEQALQNSLKLYL
jgi:hypothetical protein